MIIKDIEENFPFISIVIYGKKEYVGIIANQDQYVTTMYIYTNLSTNEEKEEFLSLGEIWWNESNRLIPINIFLKQEMESFKYCLITMNSKDVKITSGPCISMSNNNTKRIKKKVVQLVRKPPS